MKRIGYQLVLRSWLTLAVAFIGIATCLCQAQTRTAPDSLVGSAAPEFRVRGIFGESYSPAAFKGHILVMQFGSSW